LQKHSLPPTSIIQLTTEKFINKFFYIGHSLAKTFLRIPLLILLLSYSKPPDFLSLSIEKAPEFYSDALFLSKYFK